MVERISLEILFFMVASDSRKKHPHPNGLVCGSKILCALTSLAPAETHAIFLVKATYNLLIHNLGDKVVKSSVQSGRVCLEGSNQTSEFKMNLCPDAFVFKV